MNYLLVDDVLVEILKLVDTKSLIRFSICNKENKSFLQRNIKRFVFDLSYTKVTDEGLEYLKGVHTISLYYCYQITDVGLEYLKGAIIYR